MKAAVLRAPKDLVIEDVPVPKPGYGDVLVHISATAICGTDIGIYNGKTPVDYPRILGHESTGVVAEVGQGVTHLRAGDRVIMSPTSYCGVCRDCLSGYFNLCTNGGLFGREFDGTYAEYAKLAENRAFKLPDSIDAVEATTINVLSTVVYGQRKVSLFPGAAVVVIGEGPAGLLHTQLAKLRGAGPVIGVSRSAWKLDLAKSHYGADYVLSDNVKEQVLELTSGRGADFVIESAGSAATLNLATELVRPAGTILAFGITPPTISEFKAYSLYYKDLTIVGSRAMQPIDWPSSIEMVRSGKFDLRAMITHRLPLTDLEHAFELHSGQGERALRLVIET